LDAHIAARLEIGGRVFYGHNGHEIDTTFDKVNAITKTDAEGHVTQRALNAGMKGKAKTADIYVDRELCSSCGRNNGIGSLARELGLESINVHTPSGSKRYFPPK
jgi:RHS repeat protein